MKPKLKDLQNFTKQYFPRKCPVVRWKKMKKYQGLAETKKNIIYINPEQKGKGKFGCFVGEGLYKPRTKIKFKKGEEYFATLIHEIGHFKIKLKSPKYFQSIKNKVLKELKEAREKPTLDNIAYWAEEHFKKDWQYLEFRSWLGKGSMNEHIKVEDRAIKEFKKQRKKQNKPIIKLYESKH